VRCFAACVSIADGEPGRLLVGEAEEALEERVTWQDVTAALWWNMEGAVVHGGLGC